MRECRWGLCKLHARSVAHGSVLSDTAPKSKKGEVEKKVLLGRPGNNLKVSVASSFT